MKYSPLRSKYLHVVGIMAYVFLFGSTGQAQTIDKPTVSGQVFCAGSSIYVSFVVTNGKGQEVDNGNAQGGGPEKYFTTSTEYTLDLYRNGMLIVPATSSFTSDIAPLAAGGEFETITHDFPIPLDTPYSTEYTLKISSTSPSPTGNTDTHISLPFTIHAVIANNLVSGEQSGCNPYTPVPLNGSNVTGGNNTYVYSWESSTTGPDNGFSEAPFVNNSSDYDPGVLSQTTWFRRIVTSGACTSTSNTIKITVSNENKWTGALDQDWNNPGNWSCNAVPIPVTNVIIPPTLNDPVLQIGNPGTVNDLTILPDASLTVVGNALELGGAVYNSGLFDARNGRLSFTGTVVQTFSGSALVQNQVDELEVNNPAGLLLNDLLQVKGSVLATQGDIVSNGNLKLLSSAAQTALIDGSGTGEIIGNVTMQRYLSSSYGYKYFSTPFQDLVVGDFAPFMDLRNPVTGFPNFYSYNENRKSNGSDASGWEIYADPGNPLLTGHGYAVNFGNNASTPVTVELTGMVFNSPINVPVGNNGGIYTKGFNLVGNPYPCPIDWTRVGRTNVDDAIYFFSAGSTDPYTGTYSSFVGGVSSDGNTSGLIPSMQGFFVKVNEPANGVFPISGSLQFDAGARVTDQSQDFYKNSRQAKGTFPLIRLRAGYKGSGKDDALVVYLQENATPGFEKELDALEIYNTDVSVPSFYSMAERQQKLSINALSFSEEVYIGLGIKADNEGTMKIALSDLKGIPAGMNMWLFDTEAETSTDLLKNQEYEFYIAPGDHDKRFYLHLFYHDQEVLKENLTPAPYFTSFTQDGKLFVDLQLKQWEKGFLKVNNLNGQQLFKKTVYGKEQVEFSRFSGPGIFIVTLQYNGDRYSKKVIVEK